MHLEKGYLYHIYNQGNNRQKIFFNRENYLFFLKKIRTYILPFADIIAWCLMPNHFHLMILVKEIALPVNHFDKFSKDKETKYNIRSLNASIGILLMRYSKAINKQQNTSGKLIREKTKSECLNCPNGITPSFITKAGVTKINRKNLKEQYPQICFNYIHHNPVKANLVKIETDWEFSSALDYAGKRNGNLINKQKCRSLSVYYKL